MVEVWKNHGEIKVSNFGNWDDVTFENTWELKDKTRCFKKWVKVTKKVNGMPHNYFIHRAVATEFVPNPHKYKHVSHKDGNILNNHYTNLFWTKSPGHAYSKTTFLKLIQESETLIM